VHTTADIVVKQLKLLFSQKYELISWQNYLTDNQLTQDTGSASYRNAAPDTIPYRKSIIASKKLIKKGIFILMNTPFLLFTLFLSDGVLQLYHQLIYKSLPLFSKTPPKGE
jgi:hypothetical protein